MQQEGPNSSRWVPFVLDPEIELPRCLMSGGHATVGPESVPFLLQFKGGF